MTDKKMPLPMETNMTPLSARVQDSRTRESFEPGTTVEFRLSEEKTWTRGRIHMSHQYSYDVIQDGSGRYCFVRHSDCRLPDGVASPKRSLISIGEKVEYMVGNGVWEPRKVTGQITHEEAIMYEISGTPYFMTVSPINVRRAQGPQVSNVS